MIKKTQILFLVVGILLGIFLLQTGNLISGFATATGQTNVTNSPPLVWDIGFEDGIGEPANELDMTAGTTTTVWCWASVNDSNLPGDTITTTAYIYQETNAEWNSSDDNNNHYTNSSCVNYESDFDSMIYVECAFEMQYYSDPGDWACRIDVSDAEAETSSTNITTIALNPLTALDIDTTINFGTLAVGEISSAVTDPVRNYGNTVLDLYLNGTALTCDSGSIATNYLRYTDVADFNFTDGTQLSLTPSGWSDFDLDIKTNDSDPEYIFKNSYWRIEIPTGARGVCSGTIQFTGANGGYTNPGGPGGGAPL